jgi:hypothetical protein
MENKESYLEFISSESYKNQIDVWYRAYNISREKIELFHDFLISLHELIENTYLGPDVFEYEKDQMGHFTWCWNKTIENFSKERIVFKESGRHKEYFFNFYIEAFYIINLEGGTPKIKEYFNKLFTFQHKKSRSELDMLTEIYKLLDQNLKK